MSLRRVALSAVCTQDRKSVRSGQGDDLPYLGLEGIEAGTGQFAMGALSKTPETPQANSFRFDARHVLYGKLRPYLNKVALPAAAGKCSTEIVPLLPAPQIDRQYLGYFLRSPKTVAQITERSAGAQMPRADMDFVLSLPVALPSLDKQGRIVDLLGRAEGIVRLRRDAQQKAAELIPAIFIGMFGDPVTNPKGWPIASLGSTGVLDRGRSRHRPRDAAELYGGPYPFIQTGDVANSAGRVRTYSATYSEVGLAQSRLWRAGTLCITIAANIAKTGVLEFDACFPDSVVGFIPGGRMTVSYAQAWLGFLQPALEANAPQAAQKNINLETLRALPLPVPPIDLQQAFAVRCESAWRILRRQASAAGVASAAFEGLLAEAFGGPMEHA